MKLNQTIGALALALGVTSVAQAQTPVYITGSTAFRAQVYAGLADLNLTVQQGRANSANSFTFTGTVSDATPGHNNLVLGGLAGQSVTAYCTFSGSVEGIQQLLTPQANSYDAVGSGSVSHTGVDLAFSDVLQASTQLAGSTHQQALALSADAGIGGVAVQPFCVAGNATAAAKISNVTSYNLLDVLDFGGLDLSLFSGVQADSATTVLGCGRYDLSGTRVTTELDNNDINGIGDALLQYVLVSASTVNNPPGLLSTDSTHPTGTYWAELVGLTDSNSNPLDNSGTNGYFSGGNVGLALDYSSTASSQDPTQTYTAPVIGYISFSDCQAKMASTTTPFALQHGNGVFTWNGQNPGTPGAWNITGVENGTYTFWSYERLYTQPTATENAFVVNTFAPGFISAFQYAVANTVPRTACLISEMHVYRGGDGGDVLEKP